MLNKIKYNRFSNLILITIVVLGKLLNLNCSGCGEEITVTYPEITYDGKILISQDYIFNNEGLNTPYSIEENPVSKEIVVSDENNNCIYIFDSNGNFVRKVGRVGQGPGDLMGPRHIAIDTFMKFLINVYQFFLIMESLKILFA